MDWKEKIREKLLEHSVAAVLALIVLLFSVIWLAVPSEAWDKVSEAIPKRVLWALLGLELIATILLMAALLSKTKRKKLYVIGLGVRWDKEMNPGNVVPLCPVCEKQLFISKIEATYDILKCPKCAVEIPLLADNNKPFHLHEAKKLVREYAEMMGDRKK